MSGPDTRFKHLRKIVPIRARGRGRGRGRGFVPVDDPHISGFNAMQNQMIPFVGPRLHVLHDDMFDWHQEENVNGRISSAGDGDQFESVEFDSIYSSHNQRAQYEAPASDIQLLVDEIRELKMSLPTIVKCEIDRQISESVGRAPTSPPANVERAPSATRVSTNSFPNMPEPSVNVTVPNRHNTVNDSSVASAFSNSNTSPKPSNYKSSYRSSIKLKDLPAFNGELSPVHPVEFVESVTTFYGASNVPDQVKLQEIMQILKGKALTWYNVNKLKHSSFEQFSEALLKYFWGDQVQDNVRALLFTPNQYRKGGLDMTSYFLNYVHRAQYLEPPVPESLLVSTILRHFPPGVRRNLHLSACQTIDVTLEQLRLLEADPELSVSVPMFSQPAQSRNQPNPAWPQAKKAYGTNQVSVDPSAHIDVSIPPPSFETEVSQCKSLN